MKLRVAGIRRNRAQEELTEAETAVQQGFLRSLPEVERRTSGPMTIGMIGLIGSGKSTVAAIIAEKIGATVIEADSIRVALRKKDLSYAHVQLIAHTTALDIISRGGNVVLDSDYVDVNKRERLREVARRSKARLLFVRTICDLDVAIGRMCSSPERLHELFAGASSTWKGDHHAEVVAFREMTRRILLHYSWEKKGGGQFRLRRFLFGIAYEVDTATPDKQEDTLRDLFSKLQLLD